MWQRRVARVILFHSKRRARAYDDILLSRDQPKPLAKRTSHFLPSLMNQLASQHSSFNAINFGTAVRLYYHAGRDRTWNMIRLGSHKAVKAAQGHMRFGAGW
jgi:hypothetical protein